MLTYIIRRLLLMIPTLLGITAVVFFIMAYSPGGVGGTALDQLENLKAEEAKRIRDYYNKRYGLDKPPIVQYGRWLNQISPIGYKPLPDGTLGPLTIKMPDLGESLVRHRPITDLIAESLPITILLNALTIPIIYAIGIVSGILAARYRGQWFDVTSGALFLGLWSVPTIWAGVMLIGFFANAAYFKWFPTAGLHDMLSGSMPFLPTWDDSGFNRGWLLDMMWHLVLPVVCLSYGGFAYLSKLMRGSILDNLQADFVRTARAKGVHERVILFRHVFRNSVLAMITIAAGIIPALLGGSVVIETIFSIPGMGRLGVEAVQFRDRELILATTLIGGFIGLSADIFRDVWYAIADPRVSYE